LKGLKDDGTFFEKQAVAGISEFFLKYSSEENIDKAPLGTFMTADGALEILGIYKKHEASFVDAGSAGVDEVAMLAPPSGDIADDFMNRNLLATPGDFSDLKRWLTGERIDNPIDNPSFFPYENRRLKLSGRKKEGSINNFPKPPPKKQRQPKFYRTNLA